MKVGEALVFIELLPVNDCELGSHLLGTWVSGDRYLGGCCVTDWLFGGHILDITEMERKCESVRE